MAQLTLLDRDDLGRMALGTAALAHDQADPLQKGPVALLPDYDGPETALRAQKFPISPQGAPHGL
jgi:hypothetical protein